jgi:hypothetical protein
MARIFFSSLQTPGFRVRVSDPLLTELHQDSLAEFDNQADGVREHPKVVTGSTTIA